MRVTSEDRKCPYGGDCIDPGDPTDCMINSFCFNFKSKEEKKEFDNLPDKYKLTLTRKEIVYDPKTYEPLGMIDKEYVRFFKNKIQVKFFLRDFEEWKEARLDLLNCEVSDILED